MKALWEEVEAFSNSFCLEYVFLVWGYDKDFFF